MRNHWKTAHHWSVAEKGGQPSQIARRRIQARGQQGSRAVHCQRLFVQGQGSQYFEVQPPSQEGEDLSIVPVDGKTAWARVGAEMAKARERVKKQAASTVQAGERNEVNPWVERTQWLPNNYAWLILGQSHLIFGVSSASVFDRPTHATAQRTR
jgi:hypothetical protein